MSEKVHTSIPSDTPLAKSLDRNLVMLKGITGGSSDVIIKTGTLCGARIAVITCEGMADTDTLAQLIYKKLNDAGNSEKLPPEEIMSRLFDDWLIAAEQLDVLNIGDLVLKMQSGFAIVLVDGTSRGIAIGIQGYPSRGVDEPSGELNVRGSREGFVEVIRRNMALIRRRIKSPTLVFEMMVIGERSNTDICLCYLSDKASPKLLEDVKKRLKAVKLNTILESGYLQPFFEGSGGWFFSECGTCERPDSFAAKLYEGRIGILVDGTPFALTVPYLFIENFQTLDDYTQKPFYALFIRIVRLAAYFITLFLPGAYVAIASYSPELLPSSLLLNLAASEQAAPFSLMAECLLIHFMYEILREAGIRLPRPIGHAIGVVGGIVIGDITVNAGLVGAPMVLVVALSGLCSFVVPALYERTVILRFIYILAGGIFGLFGLLLAAGVIIIKMCSLNTYGVPYMAPISPYNPRSSRDMLFRAGWKRLQKGGFGGSGLAAALTAEAVRFLIALPVLIYACKGGGFYAAVWRKNRFLGWVAAVGAALLLAGFVVRTAVYASGFVRRNMLLKTPQLLIALLMAAFAVYAAVKGGEALARAGVLFLWAAGIVTVLLILADIPYMDFGRELPEWSTALFLTDVVERFCRSGEYLVFAALLPYVRSSNSADRKKLGAAGFCFAAAGAVCSALFCVFFGAVLGEYYSMADYPIAAAGSLADVVLFKRLDGAACAVWSMASAFRMGVMLFAAWSVIGEVLKCSRGASQPAPGKESCA